MMRKILAVLAGETLWTVLWIGTNAVLMSALPEIIRPNERLDHVGVLGTYLVVSVVLSVVAGLLCAKIAGEHAQRAVWLLAILQLALGIFFQAQYWQLMPVWYHLSFLALLVPATLFGGRLAGAR